MAKLLYLISEDWFFCSHFMDRAKAAQAQGFEVAVLTRESRHGHLIREAGFRLLPLEMDRSSTSVWKELRVLRQIWRAYLRERPDLVHQIALKPIIYGTFAARMVGLRAVFNAPVGMGYLFTSRGAKALLLRPLVRVLLRCLLNPRGSRVVFENSEDLQTTVRGGVVRAEDAVLIEGAGVDTALFHPVPTPVGQLVVVLAARMLKDKGIVEFVEAARLLRRRGSVAKFWLVGAPDLGNPSSFKLAQLQAWQQEGVIEWLGHQDDMASLLQKCHIACLPSYREGLPKFLLEAMATGLPVVTTDATGCRQAVEDGVSGVLVPVRDAKALAGALERLIGDNSLRVKMGAAGRERAEYRYACEHVTQLTLQQYRLLAVARD